MDITKQQLDDIDWLKVSSTLLEKGYAVSEHFLTEVQCNDLVDMYDIGEGYRKTVVMERHRFGLGEYKYFDNPLPRNIQTLRAGLYPPLSQVANQWMLRLGQDRQFPENLEDLQSVCAAAGQYKPTPLILRYGPGGFNTLHQDLYGEEYFPLQCAILLNEPGKDFTGGEFVLTQQTPRAQSKAIVLQPGRGDLLIFATSFYPGRGARGYHRVNMKHGVSEIHTGQRHTLGIIFHDALS